MVSKSSRENLHPELLSRALKARCLLDVLLSSRRISSLEGSGWPSVIWEYVRAIIFWSAVSDSESCPRFGQSRSNSQVATRSSAGEPLTVVLLAIWRVFGSIVGAIVDVQMSRRQAPCWMIGLGRSGAIYICETTISVFIHAMRIHAVKVVQADALQLQQDGASETQRS